MPAFFGPGGFEPHDFDDFLGHVFGQGGEQSRPVRRIDLTKTMTQQALQLVSEAGKQAAERGHTELDALHLLLAIAKADPGRTLLRNAGADADAVANTVEQQLPAARHEGEGGEATAEQPTQLTPAAQRVLLNAHQIARTFGSTYIAPEHLVLAMVANQEAVPGRLLAQHGVTPESLQQAAAAQTEQGGQQGSSETPTLDKYGWDLTASARDGGIDPLIGRDEEIEQTLEVLSRRTKNNPVLVGEAGVGKTAIVEGIAARIASGDVPEPLREKRVVQLDLSGMLAGTRYRGDFEERMTKVINEITENSEQLIVFLDEVHTVVGAGGAEGSVDAGNMLKPRLARGELHIIGATTLDEYRKNIEKDAALERRFQPVHVDAPSVADSVAILSGLREAYQDHHKVRYTDNAIQAAVELSDRYVTDRQLPDKAIDLIDQAGARKRLRRVGGDSGRAELDQRLAERTRQKDEAVQAENYEQASTLRDEISELQQRIDALPAVGEGESGSEDVVTAEDIAEVVSRMTGIPASRLTEAERSRLAKLEDELHARVVGQDDAVHAIARSVRRSRAGMSDPNRPVGSFLFLGPTGVGKTELAKALANSLFGDEDRMVRLDMSEFSERHTVSRLVGAPPGFVGYDEAGQLTEAVRHKPYTVVLLDEIEKAHDDVFNLLLQVLDDGRLTDGQGRTVDFKNTVLIMTSNLGSDIIAGGGAQLGFATVEQERDEKPMRQRLMGRLRENFRPEFLNRIDETVVFSKLDSQQLHTITDLLLTDSRERLHQQDVEVEFTPAAVDWIAEHGYQPDFGARPLHRTIQRQVDDKVADLLLDGELTSGSRLRVDANGISDEELAFTVDTPVAA